jgi:hypothetical protein
MQTLGALVEQHLTLLQHYRVQVPIVVLNFDRPWTALVFVLVRHVNDRRNHCNSETTNVLKTRVYR